MAEVSKLISMRIVNIGCIGPEGLTISLDKMLCLVGPNNSGKSTILRAYELATGEKFTKKDRCERAGDMPSIIEIEVHIPENIENIAEKWKIHRDELHIIKSKWEWDKDLNLTRKSWNPETNDYSLDENMSGVDNVFISRLPKPLRIGTLDDPAAEHNRLLTLIIQPIADKLNGELNNPESELCKALDIFKNLAKAPVETENAKISSIKDSLDKAHKEIFPQLSIDLKIALGDLRVNPNEVLQKGSSLKFKEWSEELDWIHQGTGSKRALFWVLLQVRSRLVSADELAKRQVRQREALVKSISSIEKKISGLKKQEAIDRNKDELEKLRISLTELDNLETEATGTEAVPLPGYMLLIDEPEVGLHPNAIRAANKYLYALADDPSWQVMISTHSPLFIDPLQDHTTIIRLERTEINPTPKLYRASKINFSPEDKENLKMLNNFDQALAEMFFGQYPIIIEGDTEFAAFQKIMNSAIDDYPPSKRPLLIRARGKETIPLIIKMLSHFRIAFSVLHDSDTPYRSDGANNSAWSANERIHNAIVDGRNMGNIIIHRVAVPNFELSNSTPEIDQDGQLRRVSSKEKPWKMLQRLDDDSTKQAVEGIFNDLSASTIEKPFDGDFMHILFQKLENWIIENAPKDSILKSGIRIPPSE